MVRLGVGPCGPIVGFCVAATAASCCCSDSSSILRYKCANPVEELPFFFFSSSKEVMSFSTQHKPNKITYHFSPSPLLLLYGFLPFGPCRLVSQKRPCP